jgi:hypothetical protein
MRVVAFAILLSACVSIPPFRGTSDDASTGSADANIGPLAARWIANAYRSGGDDNVAVGTYMMSKAGYAIQTSGIVDGDLVLFIGNVDNGTQGFWGLPAGFTQIVNHYYYGEDGQTYVVAWKIAAGEPAFYTSAYTAIDSTSGAATISLIAVTGYDPQNPIETALPTDHLVATDPADVGSPGISTIVDNSLLISASGADWSPQNGSNTFEPPADFQLLTSIGDSNTHWDWTCQAISYKFQPQAGPTGALTSTLTAVTYPDGTPHIKGGGWNVLLAIAPHS